MTVLLDLDGSCLSSWAEPLMPRPQPDSVAVGGAHKRSYGSHHQSHPEFCLEDHTRICNSLHITVIIMRIEPILIIHEISSVILNPFLSFPFHFRK